MQRLWELTSSSTIIRMLKYQTILVYKTDCNEAGASRAWYQYCRKWPVIGSQPPPVKCRFRQCWYHALGALTSLQWMYEHSQIHSCTNAAGRLSWMWWARARTKLTSSRALYFADLFTSAKIFRIFYPFPLQPHFTQSISTLCPQCSSPPH